MLPNELPNNQNSITANSVVQELEDMAFQDLHTGISVDLQNKYFTRFSSYEVFLSFLNLIVLWVLIGIATLLFYGLELSNYTVYENFLLTPTEAQNNLHTIFTVTILAVLLSSIVFKFLRVSFLDILFEFLLNLFAKKFSFLKEIVFLHKTVDWINSILHKVLVFVALLLQAIKKMAQKYLFLEYTSETGLLLLGGWFSVWVGYLFSQNNLFFSVWSRLSFAHQFIFNLLVIWPLSIVLFLSYIRMYVIYKRLIIQVDKISDELVEKCQEGLAKYRFLHLFINNRRENFVSQFSQITSFANILSAAIAAITIIGVANLVIDFVKTYISSTADQFHFIYLVPLMGAGLLWLEKISEHVMKLRSLNVLVGAVQIAQEVQNQQDVKQIEPDKPERFIHKLTSWLGGYKSQR
ncbi:MAG: hypothetical protein OT477_07185 [Chloroflexi bacterium]|nr:hypothetical protein [Chloroflexota bacterium]